MTMDVSILQQLSSMVPAIRAWIDDVCARSAADAVAIDTNKYPRLPIHFSPATIQNIKIVTCEDLPLPPIEMLGLPELIDFQQSRYDGITYIDTIFIADPAPRETLLFHELIHAVQWKALGPKDFLLAYGYGLMDSGYRDSFLETMAYDFQEKFDKKGPLGNIEDEIIRECRAHRDYLNRKFSAQK